ncbi:Prolyl tripeptidyl peptidase precursor [Planctomycetes bacterium Pla163]|uniref:Prolyl tripeptidyl peptidase n=1 Tax=Rohdeia mirabilis TaxID=2528008 RepID=A0A518CVX4_9BACT|nr:Prolyl tripeptidyl peptidase precursor [Planctomycetes bacterium Pla163]
MIELRTGRTRAFHVLRVLLLAVACVTALPTLASAQGSAAEYERARTHRQRFAGLVVGERVEPVWLAPDRLVVRRVLGADGWRYMVVDAGGGDLEDAFDHERLAAELSKELDRPFDGALLDLRILSFDRERVGFVLGGGADGFTVRRSGRGLERVALADLDGATLAVTERRRSGPGRGESSVLFANDSSVTVRLVWLDADGGERDYARVAPGEQHAQHTFAGHVWLVRSGDDREFGPFEAQGHPGLVRVTDAALATRPREPERTGPPPRDPSNSPDGRWRVVTDGARVELENRASGERVPVDLADVPQDERTRRVLWSPDSTHAVLLRVVPGERHVVHMVASSPKGGGQPRLESMDYRKPGDRIDALRIAVVRAEDAREVPLDRAALPNPWSLDELRFTDGATLTLRYNQRGHRVLSLVAIDVASGALRTVVEEAPDTFVDYSQKAWMRHLASRAEVLWTSERSGTNHLYAVDLASGQLRAVTSGPWVLRAVDEVDEAAGTALVRGLGVYPDQDPYHVHFGRVDLVNGGVTWLTASDGTHTIEWGPQREYLVATWSRVDQPPVHELRRASDGALVAELGRADASALTAAGWRAPERFTAKGRDGLTDIWGVIHTPTDFDSRASYPIVESIYAGPHGHFVPKSWAVHRGVHELVELGFVVVQIDGMGTNWRSKAFHDVCWQNLGDSGFPDRIAWIRAAAESRPWMDTERVGIYGGSAGGQSSTRALLAHGDFYDVAVSDCGCHDNRMDKIWWNEAWMGWPIGEHYAEQSNVTQAHRLVGKLLLTVGELDRNVDPASTMQVADALIRANKDFDLIVFPGAGHGAGESDYGRRRRQDFFVRHLMGVEPRWE